MKTLLITMGAYRGQLLQLDDSVAAQALADEWGMELPENPASAELPEGTDTSIYQELPQSLADFEAAIAAGATGDQPAGDLQPPSPPPPAGEAPTLASLDPATAAIGGADVTMTCHGGGFTEQSVIVFNGGAEATVFVDAGTLTTIVKPSLATVEGAVPVLVRNGTLDSNAVDFTFTAAA